MNKSSANKLLAALGHGDLEVSKAEGVWFIVGAHDPSKYDVSVETCLHVVRLSDLTESDLLEKIAKLTAI